MEPFRDFPPDMEASIGRMVVIIRDAGEFVIARLAEKGGGNDRELALFPWRFLEIHGIITCVTNNIDRNDCANIKPIDRSAINNVDSLRYFS